MHFRVFLATVILSALFLTTATTAEISPTDWIDQGDAYLQEEEYQKALFAYEEAVQGDPENDIPLGRLALVYLDMNDMVSAESYAEDALAQNPDNKDARIVLLEAERPYEEETTDDNGDSIGTDTLSFIDRILNRMQDIADESTRLSGCIDEKDWKNNCNQASSIADKLSRKATDAREEVYYIDVPEESEDLKTVFLDYARYAEEYAKYTSKSLLYYDRAVATHDPKDMERSYEAWDEASRYYDLWVEAWQEIIDESETLLG